MSQQKTLKWAVYALTAIIFATIETRVLPYARVCGVMPAFSAALTVTVAMYEGATAGAFFGLACGALRYLAPADSELIFMLTYLAGGYAAGFLCDYILRRGIGSAALLTLLVNTAATLSFFLFVMALPGRAHGSDLLRSGTLEIIMSTAVTPLAYYPLRSVHRKFAADTAADEE